jgi:hypothetical protein
MGSTWSWDECLIGGVERSAVKASCPDAEVPWGRMLWIGD